MPAAAIRASMNIHVFANDVVIANREKSLFALEFQILRLKADGSERIEAIVLADCGWPFHDNVRIEPATLSDLHTIANPAIRTNRYVLSDVRLRADNGGGVNHGCWPMEERSVASAASSGPT